MSHAAMTPFLTVRAQALRLQGNAHDYEALLSMTENRRFVLLGEATHGTQEFYRMRAEITRRLITEQGFDAVAIEGDWPDAWRVNRFVQGEGQDDAVSSLDDFERFPKWMWRNQEILSFVSWLKTHNAQCPAPKKVGFYGLDLYSLYRSADAVIHTLENSDPEQAELARQRYAALDHVREPQAYGYEAALGLRPSARDAVVAQLQQLRTQSLSEVERQGVAALDAHFFAERNATVVVNAEIYYRAMFGRRHNTWNLRDAHMRDTLLALPQYRIRRGSAGRVVVWAHNSHLGDARATESHIRGEWNLGQLMRQEVGEHTLLVGFTTYTGQVSAASRWDGEVERKWVRPALDGSCEQLFHSTGLDRFFLRLNDPAAQPLRAPLLQRAIGVIYLPQTERDSHYFEAMLADQFDAVFHLDETAALEPLDAPSPWHHRASMERAA